MIKTLSNTLWMALAMASSSVMAAPVSYTIDPTHTLFKRDAFGLSAGKDYGFSMDVGLRIQVEAVAAQ